jgi:zinc protease
MKILLTAIYLTFCFTIQLHAGEAVAPSPIGPAESAKVAAKLDNRFPHEASDVKPDPAAVWGKLDNGLRYVILPFRGQPGRASLRLYVNIGSAVEEHDEQGIAHFLEHMAFNGTRNFAPGESIKFFQRLGMTFGAHTNAVTGLDSTVYKLDLPRAEEEVTSEAFKFFRDVLDGMNLEEQEIEKERRVVLSEMLTRNSADYRGIVASLRFALPESKYSQRMPIGTSECIRGMTRDQFVRFYEKWYTPSRATVVAVGDVDVEKTRAIIERHFQDAKARREETPEPAFGNIATGQGAQARLHTEKDAAVTVISLTINRPCVDAPDTAASQRQEIVQALANVMLDRRFEKLASAPGACIQNGSANRESSFGFVDQTSATVTCESRQWAPALRLLEQEVRRAAKYGFTDDEFARAKGAFMAIAQSQADGTDTRQPAALADAIVKSLSEKFVFTHPGDDLAQLKEWFAGLTKEECHEAFRENWDSKDVQIFVRGNLDLDGNSAKKILSVHAMSRFMPVARPADETSKPFAYTDFGPAGEIVSRREHEDLGIVQAMFANNVRVNVKKTPFETNAVRVLVSVAGGLAEAPADKPGLVQFASGTFMAGGLQAHSLDEVNRLISSKNVGVQFGVGEDSFQLGGGCAPAELESQLQLLAAFVSVPGYRAEAGQQQQQFYDGLYSQLEHTPEGIMDREIKTFLRSGDVRFSFPHREAMRKLGMDDVKKWLEAPLREGYLEVSIAGNIEPDKAMALVAKTFGALPKRASAVGELDQQRNVKFPVGDKSKEFRFSSNQSRAMTVVYWPTADGKDVARTRQLGVLADVLRERLMVKVREELGAAYTPACASYGSDVFAGYGFVAAQVIVEAKEAVKIGGVISAIGEELANGAISDDEFERAIKPARSQVEQARRNNSYWLNVMDNCQRYPDRLSGARGLVDDYAGIQKAEIEALAKEYLGADKATVVIAKPSEAETK